jgi:menaquinone-specific isochorismate synthase
MTILPITPGKSASPEALRAFLAACQGEAVEQGAAVLVSISLVVPALDPLAVLEAIFEPTEPHFYAERPSEQSAIAGAEVALSATASGPGRFAAVQRFVEDTLSRTVAVGDVNAPFGGPHFFTTFSFQEEVEAGEAFPAARVFVPCWQVARAGAATTAVANIVVEAGSDLDALTQRVWRAHTKFAGFEFETARGSGGTPVGSENTGGTPVPRVPIHGRDARATPIQVRHGAHLPHWTREGAIYAVTFRLADSLPAEVVAGWCEERREIEARALRTGRELTEAETKRLDDLHSERVEAYLDSARGECWLGRPEIAQAVRDALFHFEGERYRLHAWCIMPNHVHLVIEPLGSWTLPELLHSLKSFTAKRANALLGRGGSFWQPESYDHLVRDEADYERAVEYVRANPDRVGLRDWRWVGFASGRGLPSEGSEITGGTPVPRLPIHGRDARATLKLVQSEAGDYRAAVRRGLERIAAGDFEKIVLARAIDLRADRALHPLEVLNGLRERFPECYAFSAATGIGTSFIGASPERLVRVSQGVIETEALAGSARRGAGASEDAALAAGLLRSEKDLREHRHVIGSITRRLEPLGVKLEFAESPSVKKLANVQHLHTPMRGPLPEGLRLLDLVAVLHPTPAVGGTPREAAVAAIRELEGFPRGLYAGALGWLNARGGGEFFVGLRSALVEGERARVYAGAGIVAGSEPEREFAETELKFQALLAALRG